MNKLPKDTNGWSKWELYIVNKLSVMEAAIEKNSRDTEKLTEKVNEMNIALAVMRSKNELKTQLLSVLGGAFTVSIAIAYMVLS